MKTLIDLLEIRAQRRPTEVLYRFVSDSDDVIELDAITLKTRAQFLAKRLTTLEGVSSEAKSTVLLSLSDNDQFIIGFFACLYAGLIAIPAPPFSLRRKSSRLTHILTHSQPDVVLCEEETIQEYRDYLDVNDCAGSSIFGFSMGEELSEPFVANIDENTIAFVQYTSGTTRLPRGAIIRHKNAVNNLQQLQSFFEYKESDKGLSWLPPYHDLGLTGCILHVLFAGSELTMFSPFSFARDPLKWLSYISQYKINVSAGPTFAYKKCIDAARKKTKLDFDLSSWRIAQVCAESVQSDILNSFIRVFSPAGFTQCTFYPSYGMAEATLGVSAAAWSPSPTWFSKRDLSSFIATKCSYSKEDAIELVDCGVPAEGIEVLIVDNKKRIRCEAKQLGEIWLSGPNISTEFYRDDLATRACLQASLADDVSSKKYARTGDIGFFYRGRLYVVGREDQFFWCEDRCYDSSQLERIASRVDQATEGGACAVFQSDSGKASEIVIAQELKLGSHRNVDKQGLVKEIHSVIMRETSWPNIVVKLVKPLQLPRTTSGKVQRYLCRSLYRDDALPILG